LFNFYFFSSVARSTLITLRNSSQIWTTKQESLWCRRKMNLLRSGLYLSLFFRTITSP
jgi:hypothetical protein